MRVGVHGMDVILLLGGNVGEPIATLGRAEELIGERLGKVLARSRDHWTEPWGFADDRLFLNRALLISTEHEPRAVLNACLDIEHALGRKRSAAPGYTARTIDIDLLFFGDHVADEPGLHIPHPRVHERAFALGPVADIAPALLHPTLHRSVLDLLNDVVQHA
jgi:2-amino-4-hydroxy-6-hydroxymethyldihydropteridine diphosphokinase